jgi:hypothetical protein
MTNPRQAHYGRGQTRGVSRREFLVAAGAAGLGLGLGARLPRGRMHPNLKVFGVVPPAPPDRLGMFDIHENVELEKGARSPGTLLLQGNHGPVAYRNIKITPLEGEKHQPNTGATQP